MIIELGTGYGGLADFFSMFAQVHTWDYRDIVTKRHLDIRYHLLTDIFHDHNIQVIKNLIQSEGKVFLFCDNGNKPKEFTTFSPALKPGDLVFVHDYGIEIKDQDIQPVVSKLGLRPVEQKLCDDLKTLLRGWVR